MASGVLHFERSKGPEALNRRPEINCGYVGYLRGLFFGTDVMNAYKGIGMHGFEHIEHLHLRVQ